MSKRLDPCSTLLILSQRDWQLNMFKVRAAALPRGLSSVRSPRHDQTVSFSNAFPSTIHIPSGTQT